MAARSARTPGEWKAAGASHSIAITARPNRGRKPILIATIYGTTRGEAEANARLFLAGREMLAAIHRCKNDLTYPSTDALQRKRRLEMLDRVLGNI